jgi:hypothetical protein
MTERRHGDSLVGFAAGIGWIIDKATFKSKQDWKKQIEAGHVLLLNLMLEMD